MIQANDNMGYGFWASYAPNSTAQVAKMSNTSSTYFGLQLNHSSLIISDIEADLISEIVLLGFVKFPIDGLNGPKDWRLGIGLVPLRIDLPLSTSNNLLPFITLSGGLIYFETPFPNGDGTRLNYIVDAGIGWKIKINEAAFFHLGYRIQHLSNGNSGKVNPGIDSHTIFTSIRIKK
jgi:hypothetical protein